MELWRRVLVTLNLFHFFNPTCLSQKERKMATKIRSYAEVVAGHEILPPPPPAPVVSQPKYDWAACEECLGSGFQKPMTTITGLEYSKVCNVCRGRKGHVVRQL